MAFTALNFIGLKTYFSKFCIHGSVHRHSILIRFNKMHQYSGIYLLQNLSLHASGVQRTHHQEYIKLQLQLLVQVIVTT